LVEETLYNSNIKIVEVDQIEEQGDETFAIGTYPLILKNGVVDIDRTNPDLQSVTYVPTLKSSIGVKDGKTILVQVDSGRGVTTKELAIFMQALGCTFASVTGSPVVDIYHSMLERTEEVKFTSDDSREIVMVTVEETPVPKKAKTKKK
jgi:hypothetical protein